jgi:hypothetical protein
VQTVLFIPRNMSIGQKQFCGQCSVAVHSRCIGQLSYDPETQDKCDIAFFFGHQMGSGHKMVLPEIDNHTTSEPVWLLLAAALSGNDVEAMAEEASILDFLELVCYDDSCWPPIPEILQGKQLES